METKTFNQSFNEITSKYSVENIYFKSENNKLSKKWETILSLAGVLLTIGIVMLFKQQYAQYGFAIVSIVTFPLFIYLVPLQNRKNNKKLQSNNLPFVNNAIKKFFEWKTDDLQDLRIKSIYPLYFDYSISNCEKLIEIAKNRLNIKPNNATLSFLEKSFEYFGKNYIGIIIGFFVAEASRENALEKKFSLENFYSILHLSLFLMLFFFLIGFMWNFMIKRAYYESYETKKEKLLDYIFVMENIIILKHQNEAN